MVRELVSHVKQRYDVILTSRADVHRSRVVFSNIFGLDLRRLLWSHWEVEDLAQRGFSRIGAATVQEERLEEQTKRVRHT